ncbi:MAG: hypothetical protein Q9222_007701 [Ikaeria aurantiellina]
MTNSILLSPLDRADGSATYSSNGHTVIAAVNGPVEVQRRDEIPEEAAIDVVIRPAIGVGGVRERYLESVVEKTLRQVILVSAHPRTLIQVTLQILEAPGVSNGAGGSHQSASNLPVLPALLQSSILALLSTSLPLTMTLTATLVIVSPSGELVTEPSPKAIKEATSTHILGFSSHGKLLLAESEGVFDIDTWDQVHDKAEKTCRGTSVGDSDQMTDVDVSATGSESLETSLQNAIQDKAQREQRWRNG